MKCLCILSIIIVSTFFSCFLNDGEVYLIPSDFHGTVAIIYDVANGEKEEYDGGKRVYRVNDKGQLLTNFSYRSQMVNTNDLEFYFVSGGKRGDRIQYLHDYLTDKSVLNRVQDTTVVVIGKRNSVGYTNDTGQKVSFMSFVVGPAKDVKTLLLERETIFIPDLISG